MLDVEQDETLEVPVSALKLCPTLVHTHQDREGGLQEGKKVGVKGVDGAELPHQGVDDCFDEPQCLIQKLSIGAEQQQVALDEHVMH